MVSGWTHHLFAYTKSAERESITTSRQTAAVIKTRSFPGWRRRTSSHIGKVQTTSPIPTNRQMMTALFRWRAHWKTSHTTQMMKAIHDSHHSRTRRLKRKNRRHHGCSMECRGPGNIETTNRRRVIITDLRNKITFVRANANVPRVLHGCVWH